MTITLELAVGVTEKLAGVKDGRATDLLRTFDSIHGKAEAGEESSEESFSDMEGKTVRFLWDGEKSEYKKSWHECTGKDEILNTLSPDMDVSALLPAKKVAKGDKWEVGGSKVLSLLMPGLQPGSVDLDKAGVPAEQAKAMQIMMDELGPQLEEGLKHLEGLVRVRGQPRRRRGQRRGRQAAHGRRAEARHRPGHRAHRRRGEPRRARTDGRRLDHARRQGRRRAALERRDARAAGATRWSAPTCSCTCKAGRSRPIRAGRR